MAEYNDDPLSSHSHIETLYGIVLPEGCHASGKLKRVRAEDTLTISSPECGCCQVDMLEALGHIVAQE